jgi:hypothetical protein|uniref:Glycine-rich domain-containing protein n=1 Tax=viral metagenome TaxID=1070528 RepID=A0A6C0CKD1_9ZZZZ
MTELQYYCSVTNISSYIFQDNYISFSLLPSSGTLSFTDVLINNDISINLVISAGGGGGASSGQNDGGDIANMSWGSGTGGGGGGFGNIVLQDISSTYNYTVGSGGLGGVGSTTSPREGVDGGNGGHSTFTTPDGSIFAEGGGGGESLWTSYIPQPGTPGKLNWTGDNPDPPSNIIYINNCEGGSGGEGVNNDSSSSTNSPLAGGNSSPIQTIEIYDSYNVSFGGGGGGGDASTSPQYDTDQWTQPQTSNNGGKAGLNGIGGGVGSTGTLTDASGENATTYGSGGGGAGQAGTNDSTFSTEWLYYFNNGGSGGDGVIFITFFTPPVITNYSSYISGSSINLTKNITLTATTIASPSSFQLTMSSVTSGITFNSSTGEITVDYNSITFSQITLSITATNEYGTSLEFLLTLYTSNNGCDTGPGPDPPRVWTRATTDCPDIDGEGENMQPTSGGYNLSEKRKAEIFQYRNNNANMSSKQLYSRLARGIGRQRGSTFATQSDSYTDPNTKNLKLLNERPGPFSPYGPLQCTNSKVISAFTSQNNTPGPRMLISNYPDATLYNYRVRRTYKGGNTKWPQTAWTRGDKGFPVGKKGINPLN